jgi:hypothetical protein|tara:strand:- start:937 stop:1077 length:141 start_codon:yes stop_codon:yes gene_type:complete
VQAETARESEKPEDVPKPTEGEEGAEAAEGEEEEELDDDGNPIPKK